jgi:SAM-dependent methyltransferase
VGEGVERCRRGDSFEEVADLYDRYRPATPTPAVDALINATGIGLRTRVVEFGCGTGQLSVPLAATGANLTCVEPGARLAAIAARNLSPFPTAAVECATFEDWPISTERFDAVVVANAFHWLDPDLRVTKPPALLRPGGSLAILHTHHVWGGTTGFFEASQHAYLGYGLAADLTFRPPRADDVSGSYPELEEVLAYARVRRERFEIANRYTTEHYAGLLQTDSLVNSLDPEPRRRFLHDIASLIDNSFGGVIERNYLYELVVATRR